MLEISIIIPCLNEIRYIEQSLHSIVSQDFPKDRMEVFYVDGGSTDGTREYLDKMVATHSYLNVLSNPDQTVPYALNIGIRQSRGKYIMRMDVHSTFPSDYVSKIVDWHDYLGIDNIGGVCYTDVLKKNKTSEAIRLVMSDKYGVGNSTFRVGTKVLSEVDTVPFGCYSREVFDKIGYFDVRLTRNQDIEFNKRLKRSGGLIYLVPDVHCTYYSRDTFKDFFRNRFKTGLWIVKTSFITQNLGNLSIRHFVPLMFVLSIIGPLLIATVLPFIWILSVLTLGLYVLVLGRRSFKISNAQTSSFHVFFAFMVLHFSYGLGSFIGLSNFGLYFKGSAND